MNDNMTAMNHGKAAIPNGLESSRLWRLPAELRNYIYELALRQPEPIEVRWLHDSEPPKSLASTSVNAHPAALLSTCKTVRTECSEFLYAINTFVSHSREPHLLKSRMAGEFFYQIGHANKLTVRSIAIHVGQFHSLTTPFLTMALEEILELAEKKPRVTVKAQVTIKTSGHSRQVIILMPNIAAAFQSLALKKEADFRDVEGGGGVILREREILGELREAHQLWVAKALKGTRAIHDQEAYYAAWHLDDAETLINLERGMETFKRWEARLSGQMLGQRNQPAGMSAAVNFVNALATQTMSDKADFVFVSLDFEGDIHSRGLTEFGYATLDTRDVIADRPTIFGHNYALASNHKRGFLFGDVTRIDVPQLGATIRQVCHVTDVDGMDRRMVLVGHGINNELSHMAAHGVRLEDLPGVVGTIDTGQLSKVVLGQAGTLERLLTSLEIPLTRNRHGFADSLHCAGNDAHYTLRALLLLLHTQSSPTSGGSIDLLEQMARAPLPERAVATKNDDWDAHLDRELFEHFGSIGE
ncbi:hypothetical protein LTR54_015844 [Friedmanniomyces endolithicus]|nr:hypothetical protein LTR54_015844 [Friedmanniomyces endolithicus]